MSSETKANINEYGNWLVKGVFIVLGWLAVTVFIDMKDTVTEMRTDLKDIGKDVQEVKIGLGRLDEQTKTNHEDIKELKEKK